MRSVLASLTTVLLVGLALQHPAREPKPMEPSPTATPAKPLETVTLGGGCFWCIEAVFEELRGVEKVESGYSGGEDRDPTYKEVCSGRTGHAEVVQVTFDPSVLALSDLLEVFFSVHDPTTLNRQGADTGTQYRSVIFFRTPEQERAAREAIEKVEASRLYGAPVVTQVVPFKAFYPAEDYHQEYYRLNGSAPYCRFVISPKMEKFRKRFAPLRKPSTAK